MNKKKKGFTVRTERETAELLGISRARVRIAEDRAFKKLKTALLKDDIIRQYVEDHITGG